MKILGTGQQELLERPGVATVNLIELTTFIDRDLGVVGDTFRFAEHYTEYDSQQWEPTILQIEFQRDAMRHLPDPNDLGEGSLRKFLTLRLRNSTDTAGERLSSRLREQNLENADLTWSELLIDPTRPNAFSDLTNLAGNEHLVRFRGVLELVEQITDDFIVLTFASREPQIKWTVVNATTGAEPQDFGVRLPIVYGKMDRVRCRQTAKSSFVLATTHGFTTLVLGQVNNLYRVHNQRRVRPAPRQPSFIAGDVVEQFGNFGGFVTLTILQQLQSNSSFTTYAIIVTAISPAEDGSERLSVEVGSQAPNFTAFGAVTYRCADHAVAAIDHVYIEGSGKKLQEVPPVNVQLSLAEFNLSGSVLQNVGVPSDDVAVYADVDGQVAPDGNYIAAEGALLEKMPDILRHIITVRGGLPQSVIDAGWDATADAAHLDDNVHACELNTLGRGFFDILTRLAFESRLNILLEELSTGQVYKLLVADSGYKFTAPVSTLSEWNTIITRGEPSSALLTRFRGFYDWQINVGGFEEAFRRLVQIDPDTNDTDAEVGGPTTVQLVAAEARVGRRDADPIFFLTIRDEGTCRDVLGYYASELISRVPIPVTIAGSPGFESYTLERGDIFKAKPEWEKIELPIRVTNITRDPASLTHDIDGVVLVDPALAVFLSSTQTAEVQLTGSISIDTDPKPLDASLTVEVVATLNLSLGGVPLLGGARPVDVDQPQSHEVHRSSVEFDGLGEVIRNTTEQTIGIANVWSVGSWFSSGGTHTTGAVVHIGATSPFESDILIQDAPSPFEVKLRDSAGVLFKSYNWRNLAGGDFINSDGRWHFILVTWDGTNLTLYHDGVAVAPFAKPTDIAGTMADDIRQVSIGADVLSGDFLDGRVHSVAVWNVELGANEARELFNHGAAGYMFLLEDYKDYVSSAALKHWWRPGFKPSLFGKDFKGTLDLTDGNNTKIENVKRDGPDGASIDYPASRSGRLRTDGTGALNIANVWSVSCWFFVRGVAPTSIFDALPTSGFDNQITFTYQTALPGGPTRLEVTLRDQDGSVFKQHSFAREEAIGGAAVFDGNERMLNVWMHTIFTWDGTDLVMYVNGKVHPAFLKSVDKPGTMAQDGLIFRRAAIGQNNAGGGGLDGKIHSVALLDIAMTQLQVDEAHNGGFKDFDLKQAFGSNLKHWWRLGQPTGTTGVGGDLAVDYVDSGGLSIEAENIQTTKFVTLDQDGNITSRNDTAQGKATLFTVRGEERYGSSAFGRTDWGLADSWSVTLWYKKDLAGTFHIFVLTAFFGNPSNRIHIIDSFGRIDVSLYDTQADIFRQYNTGQTFPLGGIWAHVAITYDGVPDPGVLKIYADGVEQTAPFNLNKRLDVTGEMEDQRRRLLLGADTDRMPALEGRVADITLHKNAITAAEVAQIYSRRGSFHPSVDVNDYVSAANLVHFFKPGELASDIGKDYIGGLGVVPISIGSDASEIDPVSDIVGDHP